MRIPVSSPFIGELEKSYVSQALNSKAISGLFGEFLDRFEESFSRYCGANYGVSCSNGTTAIHLALVALGIKKGDEVLVSSLTNMATFFAVLYIGARPIPVDIELPTLNMNPDDLRRKITSRSKAVLVVHLFGHPAEMDSILQIAKDNKLYVVEDCAEAHGALYKGRRVGALGDVGCFSFFANKILTTGEGGMLTTNHEEVATKARSLRSLAFGKDNKFMHSELGYNYRLTNLQAAIGCAQVEQAEYLVERRREIANYYHKGLSELQDVFELPSELNYVKSVYWMYHIVLRGLYMPLRNEIRRKLHELGVETREGFIPFNLQSIFINEGLTSPSDCPNSAALAYSTFYIPSGPVISSEDQDYVISTLFDIAVELRARVSSV